VTPEITFADIVFDKYPNWCPKCRKRPCACPAPVVRVFISSVMTQDTRAEREAARDVLLDTHLVPVMFEQFEGRFAFDQEAEALRHLAESDALLLILDNSLTSAVHTEFYAAVSQDKPVWVLLRESVEPLPVELQEFIKNLARRYRYDRFTDLNDLKFKLREAIERDR
jgi:hypothetical protein